VLTFLTPIHGRVEVITLSYSESANHVCHLYQGENGLANITLPFIRDGLRDGGCCLYIADIAAVDDLHLELEASGIDAQRARRDGALEVVTRTTWRAFCHKGSIPMAREVLTLLRQRLREFSAIRIAGDVDWWLDPATPADLLCHWEASANLVFEGLRASVLCQYDIDRYPPAFIIAALRTHPEVLYNGEQVVNPFYEAPRILRDEPMFNHNSNDADVVSQMLAQLQPSNQLETASRSVF